MSKFNQELSKNHKVNLKEAIRSLLDEESFKDFQDALSNHLVPATAIASALKSFDIEVSENTIRRWRNGQ